MIDFQSGHGAFTAHDTVDLRSHNNYRHIELLNRKQQLDQICKLLDIASGVGGRRNEVEGQEGGVLDVSCCCSCNASLNRERHILAMSSSSLRKDSSSVRRVHTVDNSR